MKVIVSACLLGENCKYNGGNNRCQKVIDFVKDHEVIPVCPEQMGGLSTPRLPAEISNGKVMNAEGVSVDAEFRKGAEAALKNALEKGATHATLNQEVRVVDASRFTMALSARLLYQERESLHNCWQIMALNYWSLTTYDYETAERS